ncbi:MAG TPA: hypothetical protein PKV33_10850 [Methanothrix sp.]|nr:hypothetical protein [Methanothrix sp.]
MAICVIVVSLVPAIAAGETENLSNLKSLLISFDDRNIDSQDLAFFLVTHNFDATPVGSKVEVKLDKKVYVLVPNGDNPGLCDIAL